MRVRRAQRPAAERGSVQLGHCVRLFPPGGRRERSPRPRGGLNSEHFPRQLFRFRVQLHTQAGERKYLTAHEIERFTAAASAHERAEVRTFCLVLAHTGCRLSEALELTARHVDLERKSLTFRTLKQRQAVRHRSVPIPAALLDALELVHRIRRQRRRIGATRKAPRLWTWGRTQAYQHVKAAMRAAEKLFS